MAFPAITGDNHHTIQNNQPFWSKDGRWRKHKGVYQEQAFFNTTSGNSRIDLSNYPELPRPVNFVELRGAFIVGATSVRYFFNIDTFSGAFSMGSRSDAYEFQGCLYVGSSMWGQIDWRANYDFEINGFPMNWGDGGWGCHAGTPAVAYVKLHALDATTTNLIWKCVFVNGANCAVVKGHGVLKMAINDFKGGTFWLNGGHAGGSIAMRWS